VTVITDRFISRTDFRQRGAQFGWSSADQGGGKRRAGMGQFGGTVSPVVSGGHTMSITDLAILSVLIGAVVVLVGLAFRNTSFD